MKNFFYQSVAKTCANTIVAIDWVHAKLLFVHVFLYNFVRVFVATIGYKLMNVADHERTAAAEESIENSRDLKAQQLELRLLSAASQVRDHAEENGEWTEEHSEAIATIGDSLLQLDWEEENIHNYLREVVESIDGLSYDLE